MAKQALGKGLGALIKKSNDGGEKAAAEGKGAESVRHVPINEIVSSPLQPRSEFSEKQLLELKESISQHGIIQPLIVRLVGGKYELIAGERRWRASTALGLASAPVIVREASDSEVLEMALIENLQREDLNPMEEAKGYVRLADEFSLKQTDIAKRVGKSRASVANSMRLLDLHEDLQGMVSRGGLSVGHAKAVLGIKEKDAQVVAVDQILKKGLNVRATEKFVHTFQTPSPSSTPAPSKKGSGDRREVDAALASIEKKLEEVLGSPVSLSQSGKKGRIEIKYFGNDDLERILDLLGLPSDTL